MISVIIEDVFSLESVWSCACETVMKKYLSKFCRLQRVQKERGGRGMRVPVRLQIVISEPNFDIVFLLNSSHIGLIAGVCRVATRCARRASTLAIMTGYGTRSP